MVDQIYVANLVAWFNKKKRKPKQSTKLCDLKKKVLKSGKNVSRLRGVSEFWRINHSKWNEKVRFSCSFQLLKLPFEFQNIFKIEKRTMKLEKENEK